MSVLDGFYQSRMIRRLVTVGLVDLIHQPSPVSPLEPSDLHRFGVPLVIGPMNDPPGYEDYEGRGSLAGAVSFRPKMARSRQ
ncbi:MAG: hypothetical protein E2586_23030 [Novosphingobium sp.]|uniref:hypothetical protein n=1 Tax=Novosphingobium sp. TaxID=1874826 RepID=UPI0012C5F18B|nr:hypothetical protein [Novosphingobium sp.]MPS71356.1 hypothetical protein [Novosphingobium sp.]